MYVTLNPQYGIRNEKNASYICLLDSSVDSILAQLPSFLQIPPLYGYIISQFNGKKLEISLDEINHKTQINKEVISKFLLQLINNPSSLEINYQGSNVRFPPQILIGSDSPFKNNNPKIVTDEDFSPFNEFIVYRPSVPLSVNIMLTTKCKTDCIYCYADRNTKVDFKLTELTGLLDECYKFGVLRVGLSGGDIFAYKNWKEVIDKMHTYQFSPFISTKIPLDAESILFLKTKGIKEIQFSLDSVIEEESKIIVKTNIGYISKVKEMFIACRQNNLKVEVQTVLTKYNANKSSLSYLYQMLLECGVDTWSIVPAFYSNFKGEYEDYRADDKMLEECYQYLLKLQNKTNLRVLIRGLENKMKTSLKFEDTDKFIRSNKGCTITAYSMWINVYGQIALCEMLYNNQLFHLGSINEKSIKDICQSEEMRNFYEYKISNLNINEESKCYSCKDYNRCKIGNIKKVCMSMLLLYMELKSGITRILVVQVLQNVIWISFLHNFYYISIFKIMKIVQSYWSKPYDKVIGSYTGGWFNKTFHYMSCALSCLKAKEFYPVELITDKKGKQILIDEIGLPYSSFDDCLEYIDYPIDLWAVGKLYAYDAQNEPFIHMDNDIYIWKPFPEEMVNSELISQSFEGNYDFYREIFTNISNHFDYIPNQILTYRESNSEFNAVNAGLLGGCDILFIKEYVKEAFDFIEKNLNRLDRLIDPSSFNLIFEQYLFYCMAQNKKEKIFYYLEEKMDSRFKELVNFWTIPHQNSYIHSIASYKKHYIICEQITQRLWYEYPEYYKRIHELIIQKKI